MKNVNLVGILFLSVALCLGSCSKTGPAGPRGEQGQQGTQGEKGPAGPQGISGVDGSTIYSDNGAPTAKVGKNGDYYLDRATGNLYGPKTDNKWLGPISLKGLKGDKGATGPKGDKGNPGPQGPKGDKGNTGAKGAKGDPGQDGKDGSQILSGTSVPATSIGEAGDYYWDTSNFTLYGPKVSSGWGAGILLQGPKGDPGTMNIIYSDWFKLDGLVSINNSLLKYISSPVTSDFLLHNGTVLSYLMVFQTRDQDTMNAETYPLPEFIPTGALGYESGQNINCFVVYNSGLTTLEFSTTDGSNFPSHFLSDFERTPGLFWHFRFRYMLIPGGTHVRSSSPPPDPKDYKATCEYYGIPE